MKVFYFVVSHTMRFPKDFGSNCLSDSRLHLLNELFPTHGIVEKTPLSRSWSFSLHQ